MRHLPIGHHPRVRVGALSRDSAAVVRLSEDQAIVATVDFFTPIVDDAYTLGAIAAANAFSDLYAMGATPLFGLNLVGWPRKPEMLELLGEVIRGGGEVTTRAGAFVLGGHSIDDNEPKFGMVALGVVHPDRLVTNAGASVGDQLILTKPIGTGILSTALKREAIAEVDMQIAIDTMTTLNDGAAGAMKDVLDGVHAATDITGFGLLGHLNSLLLASGVAARVNSAAVPHFAKVLELIDQGMVPGGTERNLTAAEEYTTWHDVGQATRTLLADAQTSGGLLLVVAPDRADDLRSALLARRVPAIATIGEIVGGAPGTITVDRR